MTTEKPLNLRSETVQEILSVRPHWVIRYGNLITVFLCVILLIMAAFVRYPVYTSVEDFQINRVDSGYVISGKTTTSDWQKTERKSLFLKVWANNRQNEVNASGVDVEKHGGKTYFKLKVGSVVRFDNVKKMEFRNESTLLRVLMKTVF